MNCKSKSVLCHLHSNFFIGMGPTAGVNAKNGGFYGLYKNTQKYDEREP